MLRLREKMRQRQHGLSLFHVEEVDFGVENVENPVERPQQVPARALVNNTRMDVGGRQVSTGVNDRVYDECGQHGYARCLHRYAKI